MLAELSPPPLRDEPASVTVGGIRRVLRALAQPVDGASTAWFRCTFGLLLAWEAAAYLALGRVDRYYLGPDHLIPFPWLEWVRPLPGPWLEGLFVALFALALCVAAGFLHRLSAALYTLGFTYVFLLDASRYLNHHYLVCLLAGLLAVVPANRCFSVDARLRPRIASRTVPAWSVWLLRFQVAVPYVFGGIAKLNPDWLAGEPLGTWLAGSTDTPLIGPLLDQPWAGRAFSLGGLAFDLAVVPLLLWRRTRLVAFGAVALFHLTNAYLFSIGVFPWLMIAATLVFFPPDWPRRLLPERLQRPPERRAAPPLGRWAAGLLAVYVAVQVLAPLRHLLYAGPVSWTEEGHNFAWHMKLRDKDGHGEMRFQLVDRQSGETWVVEPSEALEAWQAADLATRPDMILSYAHHLAESWRRRGHDVEVYAWSEVSLNGRRPQLLVDPRVDLATRRHSLLPADWILPLAEELPRRTAAASPR